MPDGAEFMPTLTEHSGAETRDVAKLSFLGAEWINQRIFNVAAKVDKYIDRIIDQGLLEEGFAPFESPITDEILMKMSPEQFRILYDSEPTMEGKALLIARTKNLKMPTRELLPELDRAFDPYRTTPPLANEANNAVSSSEATV